jgi:hypothetical protein
MDKWVVRRWDAHRTDYCRTGASSGATQRYSYDRVPRFAGRVVVGGFALLQSCTCRGVKYSETLEKLVNIGTGQNSCLCRLTSCRWIHSTAEIRVHILYLSVQK